MIQRIQSVYLAVAGLMGIVSLFFNIGTDKGFTIQPFVHPDGSYCYDCNHYYGVLVLLIVVSIFFTLLKFKNRKLQIKLCLSLVVFFIINTIIFSSLYIMYPKNFSITTSVIFTPIQLILVLLALRAIKKDEELIRSVDRIR
jgi:hypothetical protein